MFGAPRGSLVAKRYRGTGCDLHRKSLTLRSPPRSSAYLLVLGMVCLYPWGLVTLDCLRRDIFCIGILPTYVASKSLVRADPDRGGKAGRCDRGGLDTENMPIRRSRQVAVRKRGQRRSVNCPCRRPDDAAVKGRRHVNAYDGAEMGVSQSVSQSGAAAHLLSRQGQISKLRPARSTHDAIIARQ